MGGDDQPMHRGNPFRGIDLARIDSAHVKLRRGHKAQLGRTLESDLGGTQCKPGAASLATVTFSLRSKR